MHYINSSDACHHRYDRFHHLGSKLTIQRAEVPVEAPIASDNFVTTHASENASEPNRAKACGLERSGAPVSGTPPLPPAPQSKPIKRKSKPRKATGARKPRWRDLDELQKLQAGIESAGRLDGFTFSLNLGIGRESALWNSDDPIRLLSTYISRELRKAIGHDLPYSFVLELARDKHGFDRLHAHGTLVPGDANLDRIKDALVRAGGKINGRAWSERQLDMKPITSAAGWTAYITKARRWGKARPHGRPAFISRPLKQIARQDYDEFGLSQNIIFSKTRKTPRTSVNPYLHLDHQKYCSSVQCFFTRQESPKRFITMPVNTKRQGGDALLTETYIADDRYHFEVAFITDILRAHYVQRVTAYPREIDPAELYERLHVALRSTGLNMGEFRLVGGRVEPERYRELVQALADLEPDTWSGEYEPDQVMLVLGEEGNVWPASIRLAAHNEAA